MYLFKKAIAVSKDIGSRWNEVDISQVIMSDIFMQYRKVYVTLNNNFLEEDIYIDLDSLRDDYSLSSLTFNDILISIGNTVLETIDSIPELNPKYVKFSDAFRAGYKLELQNINTSITANVVPSTKTSLRINRDTPSTDMGLFYKNCMVSINGYFHRTDYDGVNAYILDGAKSLFKSRQNQIGLVSFLDVAEIEQVPLLIENIKRQQEDTALKTRASVTIDKDIIGKTVLLVLGGYLLFPEADTFWQTGDNTFILNFEAMPLLERYYESLPYINFDGLELPVSTDNETVINLEQFYSDENLKKLLTLSQSFFVVIDTPELFVNKIYLRSSNLPGMFTSYQEPNYPLFVNNGRLAEYWKTPEDGHWSVTVQDSYLKNAVFSSIPTEYLVNISSNKIPERPTYNSRGFLLEFGRDI